MGAVYGLRARKSVNLTPEALQRVSDTGKDVRQPARSVQRTAVASVKRTDQRPNSSTREHNSTGIAVPGSRDFLRSPAPAHASDVSPLLIGIYYIAVWLSTFALAHIDVGTAAGVGGIFGILPCLYALSRMRVERIVPWLTR